ncbi:DUF6912 family protein [Corynebacterium comes]|uniref:Uncharacterized protein n=1 Tax=Corynebacterium comes TaxID=2675218 RepID=A0A6B8WAM9_9CORY|nr:hypothetical protein [Corynebacterium comes]QGU03928.1 hypothetical protein CETAM_03240 [Corynebacterium comes]
MRIYLPATFAMLTGLNETGKMPARSGWGFAATPALVEFYTSGDEEEIGYAAYLDAAEASLRLLAIGDEEAFPYRRVVVSVDLDDSVVTLAPDNGESVVALSPAEISLADIAAIHIDVEEAEEATRAAIAAIDASDLGDEDAELTVGNAQDNFMAFYDPTELPFLVELL